MFLIFIQALSSPRDITVLSRVRNFKQVRNDKIGKGTRDAIYRNRKLQRKRMKLLRFIQGVEFSSIEMRV